MPEDIRELEDGFKARKWPDELDWRLTRNGQLYASRRTIKQLRNLIAIRAEWRKAKKKESTDV